MIFAHHKLKFFLITVSVLLTISFYCISCTSLSRSDELIQYAKQDFSQSYFDEAFNQNYDALIQDIDHKESIQFFPTVFEKSVQHHLEKAKEMKASNDWDGMAREYQKISKFNDSAKTIVEMIKSQKNYQEDPDKKRLVNIELIDVKKEISSAKNNAALDHYNKATLLAKSNKFREATEEFENTLSFIANFKNASELKSKYKKLADEKDSSNNYEQGLSFAKQNKHREASRAFNASISYIPDYKDAAALYDKHRKIADEIDAKKHYDNGIILANKEQFREASNEFNKALSYVSGYLDSSELETKYDKLADEQDASRHYEKGKLLMQQKKYALAYDEFIKASDLKYGFKDSLQLAEECKYRMPPSESEIKSAITRSLQQNVPISWVGNLMGGKKPRINYIQIVKIGVFNDRQQYWPMKIRVEGSCQLNDPFNQGKTVSFDKVGEFRLIRDDYGEWQAGLVGGMFQ